MVACTLLRSALGALAAHFVSDQKRVNRAVVIAFVKFERAINQRLDHRHLGDQIGIVLGIGNRRRPGNRCPVKHRDIGGFGDAHRGFRLFTQRFCKSAMPHFEAAQAVVAGPQIELSRPRPQFRRRRQILFLRFVRVLLNERVGKLREAARGGEEQAFVLRTLGQQTLHQLQTEGHRRPDQLRVVVRGKR